MATTMKARPTTYKGIKMRSRLEAGLAQWLDQWHFDWEYEPECFASPSGQYLPDFLLRDVQIQGEARDLYIECKPRQPDHAMVETIRAQWAVLKVSQPEARMAVMFPRDTEWDSSAYVQTVPHFVDWSWVYRRNGAGELTLGIECVLEPDLGPWPDGYWKAT
jgi:hypothetical protein